MCIVKITKTTQGNVSKNNGQYNKFLFYEETLNSPIIWAFKKI